MLHKYNRQTKPITLIRMDGFTKPLFLGRLRQKQLTSNQMVGQYDVNYPIKQCNLDGVITMCTGITVKHLAGYLQCNGGQLNNIDCFRDLNCLLCAEVCDLLSNNSLFVGQL